jgi:hypothetical protein
MSEEAEVAVRRYLDFLADPTSIVDKARIATLEAELASAKDPMTKLHTHAALEKARHSDGDSVRSLFVKHARAYALAHELPASAFRSVGVSEIALVEAGFDLGHGRLKAKAGKAGKVGLPAGRQRAPKVSKSSIQAHILSIGGSFTLNDVMSGVGGSIGTVNTVVKELVTAGKIKQLGPDTNHQGRGRAPIRYSK